SQKCWNARASKTSSSMIRCRILVRGSMKWAPPAWDGIPKPAFSIMEPGTRRSQCLCNRWSLYGLIWLSESFYHLYGAYGTSLRSCHQRTQSPKSLKNNNHGPTNGNQTNDDYHGYRFISRHFDRTSGWMYRSKNSGLGTTMADRR